MPKATLLALLVLVAAEVGVRYRKAQSDSIFGHSFVFQFHRYEQMVQATPQDIWLIGNSTLAAGLDEPAFEAATGLSTAKMPHGSCSLAGYAALVDYYLDRGPAPKRLVIFITKDDLNLRGLRADSTEQYTRYVEQSPLRPSHWMMLYYDRLELKQAAVDQIDACYSAVRGQPTARSQRFQVEGLDRKMYQPGQDLYQVYNLREAARDWELDRDSVRAILDSAERHGVEQTCFVLLPCTDELAQLHDQLNPEMRYEQVRREARQMCEQAGVPYLDLAVATGRHDLFFDAFHFNVWGQRVLTQTVSRWIMEGAPSREPLTEAKLDQLATRVLSGDQDYRAARTDLLAEVR